MVATTPLLVVLIFCLQLQICIPATISTTRFQKLANFTSRLLSFKLLNWSRRKPRTSATSPASVSIQQATPLQSLSSFLSSGTVDVILNETIPFKLEDVWKNFLQPSQGYKNFLVSDGDFDVETTEWRELPSSSQQVPEDWGHFPFNQGRQFNFQHKRTSMLFIGPKNAPTAQKQYALTDKSGGGFGLSSLSSVVFLIVSKFEEIPFSDCFKVLQYWVLEKGSRPDTTRVALGVGLHFNKSTMMRGKIESGAKEEMVTQARRVLASMVGSVQSGGKAAAPSKMVADSSFSRRYLWYDCYVSPLMASFASATRRFLGLSQSRADLQLKPAL